MDSTAYTSYLNNEGLSIDTRHNVHSTTVLCLADETLHTVVDTLSGVKYTTFLMYLWV